MSRLGLSIEEVTTTSALERLAPEWHALHVESGTPFPFQHHDWAVAWWQHLRRRTARVVDRLRVLVVRDEMGSAVGIAPLMTTAYGVFHVPAIRLLHPLGADPNITELRTALLHPERATDAARALAAHVASFGGFDLVRWGSFPAAGAAVDVLANVPGASTESGHPAFLLELPDSWEEFRSTRPRNLRESLRKCYNSLARDGHAWRFHALTDPQEIARALGRFCELHSMRASHHAGVVHPDNFSDPAARRFLEAVTARFAARGAARLFALEVGGILVAMRLGYVVNGCLYLYFSGYDPEWGRYSVMTTVVAEAIRDAISSGVRLVNLSLGSDVSKLRWRPDILEFQSVSMLPPGTRGRIARAALRFRQRQRAREVAAAAAGAGDLSLDGGAPTNG